ncbi:hypothetical protein EDC04DRAFT_2609498 [Pisolithus marmoratus]|nr:hypothetical protein EDC04DRAFT_2609498 [Pisolithus marmoratus]
MAEIFHEMVVNLPSVLDTLEESVALSIDPITVPDNVVATVSMNDPGLEGGIDNVALQFAASHLIIAPLAVLFGGFGVDGWVMLCKRLVLKYMACIGIESLQAFHQKQPEDIIEFIQSEYEEMVHEGSIIFEDGFLRVLVQMVHMILNHGTHHGIYSYNFFHDFGTSQDVMAILFTGNHAQQTMALALRNAIPFIGGTLHPYALDMLFGIFDCVCGNNGNLCFCLLESSHPHTTNVISSMVLLVMDIHHIRNHYIPTLLECRLAELKAMQHRKSESGWLSFIHRLDAEHGLSSSMVFLVIVIIYGKLSICLAIEMHITHLRQGDLWDLPSARRHASNMTALWFFIMAIASSIVLAIQHCL